MESKAKLLGHPIHQMLIVFPLGLLATSLVFDFIALLTDSPVMGLVSYWMIISGLVGGVIASIFGVIDWLGIPRGTRAYRIGLWHGLGNLLVMLLFFAGLLVRLDEPRDPGLIALGCSIAGAAVAGLTGWLGGELVDRLGVGVHHGAHVNAPNSLSGRPAHAQDDRAQPVGDQPIRA